jgi:hypothetical protein
VFAREVGEEIYSERTAAQILGENHAVPRHHRHRPVFTPEQRGSLKNPTPPRVAGNPPRTQLGIPSWTCAQYLLTFGSEGGNGFNRLFDVRSARGCPCGRNHATGA